MGRRIWTTADIDRMIDMRDVQRMKWIDIGKAFGRSESNCAARYCYYHAQRRVQAVRRGETPPERPAPFTSPRIDARAKAPPRKRKAVAALAPKPVRAPEFIHRPRYFHEADADIAARIRRQGLTAGFLGDPPAGRSALDQKQGSMS